MKRDFSYRRMPGALRGWIRKATLWEGSDHVLLVKGTRFQEEYRRFQYRDIESLLLVRTFRLGSMGWLALNALLCSIFFLGIAIAPHVAVLTMLLCGLVTLALLAQLYLALRHGCRCYVQTAVSREEIPSLIRTWTAGKAFRRLRERIAEAQGTLPEDLGALIESAVVAEPERAPAVDNGKRARLSVNLGLAAVALFLVDAIQTYPMLQGPSLIGSNVVNRYLTPVLIWSMAATVVGSLLSGLRVRRLKALRGWMIAALIVEGFDLMASLYVLPQLYTVQRRSVSISMAQLSVWHGIVVMDELALLTIFLGGLFYVLANWSYLRRGDL